MCPEQLWVHANRALLELAGLDAVTAVGSLQVSNNASLQSLEGLSSLISVDEHVLVSGNASLPNVGGLDSLVTVETHLAVVENDLIADLLGLSSVETVGGSLILRELASLESLDGLDALTTIGEDLRIFDNPVLTCYPTHMSYRLNCFRFILMFASVTLQACSGGGEASDSALSATESTSEPTSSAVGPTSGSTSDGTNGRTATGATTTATACDAAIPADAVPPRTCENPYPISQGAGASGWIGCDGGRRHRETAVDCESPTDCASDADCGDEQICECSGSSSTCITAYCTTDADCLEGYHCWRGNDVVACDGPYDRCRVEPCHSDGTVCEICQYDASLCAMDCIDHGPCTG